jgi:hypothetical protein
MSIKGREKPLSRGTLEGKTNYKKERKIEVSRKIKWMTERTVCALNETECRGRRKEGWGEDRENLKGLGKRKRERKREYVSRNYFNPLRTKRRPLYIKTQSVPRSKHF